jgi:signal recognition particle receptor subunit beta
MASLNPLTRELVFKIVFYGPGLGGKTTTLQYIHAATKPEHRGKMVSLATPTDRTLYFDFVPLRIPRVRGMSVRLQLFTVPGQVYFAATRKLVLSGVDGIVFVADSQAGRMDANRESLEDLHANLIENEKKLEDVAHTFHWNKRDLSDLVPLEELDKKFNLLNAPSLGTVATHGDGVFQGLERITRLVMRSYEQDAPRSDAGAPSGSGEAGIAEAIRGLTSVSGSKVTPPLGTPSVSQVQVDAAMAGANGDGEVASSAFAARPSMPMSVSPPTAVSPSPVDVIVAPRFSFAEMWPEDQHETARHAESMIASRDPVNAVLACDLLVTRVFASAAALAGTIDAPRDPALVAMLLGMSGARYLAFRASVRAARQHEVVSQTEALEAYAFAIEARRARDNI